MFIFRLFLSFVKHFWLPDCLVVSHSGVIAVLILTYLMCIPKIFLWIGEIFPIFISFITPKQKRCRQIPIKTAQIDSSMNAYRKETPDKQKSAFFIPEKTIWGRIKRNQKRSSRDYLQPGERSADSAHTLMLSATLPLNLCYKTPYQIVPYGAFFHGHTPSVSPFAWQSNKAILFYFTPNSKVKFKLTVSDSFSTNVDRPSSCH